MQVTLSCTGCKGDQHHAKQPSFWLWASGSLFASSKGFCGLPGSPRSEHSFQPCVSSSRSHLHLKEDLPGTLCPYPVASGSPSGPQKGDRTSPSGLYQAASGVAADIMHKGAMKDMGVHLWHQALCPTPLSAHCPWARKGRTGANPTTITTTVQLFAQNSIFAQSYLQKITNIQLGSFFYFTQKAIQNVLQQPPKGKVQNKTS